MEEVKEILSFEINTNIYDFELSEKIFERVKNTKFDINPKCITKLISVLIVSLMMMKN